MKPRLKKRAAGVKLIVLDVDGVLTDGGLYYGQDGEAMKRFDVKDGHGIVIARHMGIPTAILTARKSGIVAVRGKELKMPFVLQGERDKAAGFAKLLALANVTADECCYMGDDVNDLPVLTQVGFSCCPADARQEVRDEVHYVCEAPGGRGAVRELCELILQAKGLWQDALALHAQSADAAPLPSELEPRTRRVKA